MLVENRFPVHIVTYCTHCFFWAIIEHRWMKGRGFTQAWSRCWTSWTQAIWIRAFDFIFICSILSFKQYNNQKSKSNFTHWTVNAAKRWQSATVSPQICSQIIKSATRLRSQLRRESERLEIALHLLPRICRSAASALFKASGGGMDAPPPPSVLADDAQGKCRWSLA